jgi:hypothetical protein
MHLAGLHAGYFVAAYLSCWLIGFAHHDRLLRRVPWRWYGGLVAGLAGAGGTWVVAAMVTGRAVDLNHIAGGTTLWSMALVAVLLRVQPRLAGRAPCSGWSTPERSPSTCGTSRPASGCSCCSRRCSRTTRSPPSGCG